MPGSPDAGMAESASTESRMDAESGGPTKSKARRTDSSTSVR
jgi:hypothetical protein